MADTARIEELRRRVQSDPASIAFAALAEEYRRAGQYEEAIATCKTGLRRHPAYLSAHVTLGRALIEVGQYDEARVELEHVLKMAPENLAATRGLAEIRSRLGQPEPSARIPMASEALPPAPAPRAAAFKSPVQPAAAAAMAFQPASTVPLERATSVAIEAPEPWEAPAGPEADVDPALPRLEKFLDSIERARAELETDTSTERA